MKQWPCQRPSSQGFEIALGPDRMPARRGVRSVGATDGTLTIPRKAIGRVRSRWRQRSRSRSRIRSAAAFASGPVLPTGPDAPRASVLALALGDQTARRLEQLVVHPEQRLAEPDAARVVVVDEDPLRSFPTLRRRPADLAPIRPARSRIDRDADVVAIAHQQQLRDLPHRERQPDDAVAAIVGGVRQRAPSPRPESSASTPSCASAARAGRARPTRRSRSCRT